MQCTLSTFLEREALRPVLVMIFASLAAGCVNARGRTSLDAIEGPRWTLVELNDQSAQASDSAHRPWIQFSASDGTVSGNGGCNRFGGKYTRSDSSLHLAQLVSTKMACALNPLNAQEQQYLGVLAAADYFSIAGDTLSLFDTEAQTPRVARFVR